MHVLSSRLPFLLLVILAPCLAASPMRAQEPPRQLPWGDPQAMFEQIFGKEGEADEKALAEIEVSIREEQQIGKRAVDAYLRNLKGQRMRVVTRGKEVEYLRRLVEKIQPMMENPEHCPTIHVYLVLSPRCDARVFPGGHFVFFRGLLETARNEAALIGVVGHEVSHLDRGHLTRRIKQMKLAEETFAGRGKPTSMEKFFAAGGVMMRTWLRPFRPEHEKEADLDGARWSYRAGYDCREMAKLFLRLHERRQNPAFVMPEFFRSHPEDLDRHRAVMEHYRKLQEENPNDKLHVGGENLRRRIARER